MSKLSKNEQGFSVIEIIMVIVIVGLIGAVGYMVYKNKHQPTKVVTVTKTVVTPAETTYPSSGWKTGSLKYEQITYKYPSNWTLSGSSLPYNQQNSQSSNLGLKYNPGIDNFILTSPNGNKVILNTGEGAEPIPFQTTGIGVNIQTLGNSYSINFGVDNGGELPSNFLPDKACIGSPEHKGIIVSKNITYKDSTNNNSTYPGTDGFCYVPKQTMAVSALETDPDFATAKQIFESMKFQ